MKQTLHVPLVLPLLMGALMLMPVAASASGPRACDVDGTCDPYQPDPNLATPPPSQPSSPSTVRVGGTVRPTAVNTNRHAAVTAAQTQEEPEPASAPAGEVSPPSSPSPAPVEVAVAGAQSSNKSPFPIEETLVAVLASGLMLRLVWQLR